MAVTRMATQYCSQLLAILVGLCLKLTQNLHRFGPKLSILAAKIRLGELSGRPIELGIANLAVLRLLAILELAYPRILDISFIVWCSTPKQRPADKPTDGGEQDNCEENLYHGERLKATRCRAQSRESSFATRAA